MSEDWSVVAKAINERVRELGWRQRELAERSRVSQAIVREIQHHTVERRRSARTLEALSTALGWHPQHLRAVLWGRQPPSPDEPEDSGGRLWSRLDELDNRISDINDGIDELRADVKGIADAIRQLRS